MTNLGELELRPSEHDALVNGERLQLSPREFGVLAALVAQADRVVPREDLYAQVWGRELRPDDRSVDVVVRKLRRKLAVGSPRWRYVHTRFGIGYRFTPERDRQSTPARTP